MSKETKALKDLKKAYDKALEQSRQHEFREYLNLQRLDKAEKKIEELEKELTHKDKIIANLRSLKDR